jgi:hypothetical protein
MEKQTAVEWLESEIEKQIFQCETEWQCGYQKALNEVVFLLKQAKEMEKQQIENAYTSKCSNYCCVSSKIGCSCGVDYYQETFKSEKNV